VPGETQRTDTFLISKIFINFDLTTSATFSRPRGTLGDMLSTGILVYGGMVASPGF
jgi:hypothetical protein